MEIVLSHFTALDVLRRSPVLAGGPRVALPADFASAPISAAEVNEVIESLAPGSASPDSSGPIAAQHHCMFGTGWKRRLVPGIASHSGGADFLTPSFIPVAPGVYVASPELAFVQCCRGRSFLEQVLLGFEVCGTYATLRTCSRNIEQAAPLSSVRDLAAHLGRCRSVYCAGRIGGSRVLDFVADGSASYQESRLALLFGLPSRLGGRGLGMPLMNHIIPLKREAAAVAQRGFLRADLCWPRWRIDVEYASRKHHSDPDERVSDLKRQHALEYMGWKVVQVSEVDIASPVTLDAIAASIRGVAGLRRPRREAEHLAQRRALEHFLSVDGLKY